MCHESWAILGQIQGPTLDRHRISEYDLLEDLRLKSDIDDPQEVLSAQIKRNGEISVQRQARVIVLSIVNGIQTVRVELDS